MNPLAQELRRGLVRALHPLEPARAMSLAETVLAQLPDPSALEASVRMERGAPRGGRMMVERAEPDCAREIASALALPWRAESARLVEAVQQHALTLITGWDVGGARPLYKLYANASDASSEVRASVAAELGAPGAPHVFGLNVHAGGIEPKAYTQHDTRPPLPFAPSAMRGLRAAAWVTSHDLTPSPTVRALFVAPVETEPAEAVLMALTGRSYAELADAMPFSPGPIRQLGVSPTGAVTVYAKPRHARQKVHRLGADAVFFTHAEGRRVEVGLHVAPTEDAPRAFTRTARYALSFRTRQGTPPRGTLEPLGRWAAQQIGVRDAPWDLSRPPAPWSRQP